MKSVLLISFILSLLLPAETVAAARCSHASVPMVDAHRAKTESPTPHNANDTAALHRKDGMEAEHGAPMSDMGAGDPVLSHAREHEPCETGCEGGPDCEGCSTIFADLAANASAVPHQPATSRDPARLSDPVSHIIAYDPPPPRAD